MSVDGKTTKWHRSKIYEWTSLEDREYFASLLKRQEAIIVGRKTYAAAKTFTTAASSALKIVLTSQPKKYHLFEKRGKIEFSNNNPRQLVKRLTSKGFKTAVLIGGERTNAAFLASGLVNEIWITVEPVIFGYGHGLSAKDKLSISLTLFSAKKLNERGTILLKYKVAKTP